MKEQGKEGSNCDKKYCLICCLIERKESVKSIGGRVPNADHPAKIGMMRRRSGAKLVY